MIPNLLFLLTLVSPLGLLGQPEPLNLPDVSATPVFYSILNHHWPNSEGYHPVSYFGLPPDTLDIPFQGYVYPPREWMPPPLCVNRNPAGFRTPLPGDLLIAVFPLDTMEMEDMQYGQDSSTFFKALPVIVANNSTDTLVIGTAPQQEIPMGDDIRVGLIHEAKDETGTWRAIELPYTAPVSHNALVLPGRQIAVTSVYFYEGTFETDLRLRLGDAVSETYRGWVNPAAFR